MKFYTGLVAMASMLLAEGTPTSSLGESPAKEQGFFFVRFSAGGK